MTFSLSVLYSLFRLFWLWLLSLLLSGFALALFGRYSFAATVGISLGLTGLFGWLWRHKSPCSRNGAPGETRWVVATAVLGLITLFFTLPPGEWIPGGWDPSVYVQTAAQVEQSGGLLFDHPDLMEVDAELQQILYRDVHHILEPFGGMRVLDEKITPQFYHVYPVFLAGFVSLGGVQAALWANPLLNVLSVGLMFLLLRLWTGKASWGFGAALTLALFPGQIWQAKFSTAEMLTQVLILGGFCFLLHWSHQPETRKGDAFLSGLSLGTALLTRYDSLMCWMVLAPVLCFYVGQRQYRKGLAAFAISLPFLFGLWLRHQQIAPFYSPLGSTVHKVLGACGGLCLLALVFGFLPWIPALWTRLRRCCLSLLTLGWAIWVLVLWQIRPELSTGGRSHSFWMKLASPLGLEGLVESFYGPAKVAMLYLESLFTPLGLALVLLFVPVLWWQAKGPARAGWTFSGLAVMLVLTWAPLNDLFMIWVSRRFNPLVIPWMISGTVIGLQLMQSRLQKPALRLIPVGVLLLIIALQLPSSRFMMRNREWPGSLAWFEQVAEELPENALMYTDQPGFGAPFRFIWGKRAFELRRQKESYFHQLLEHMEANPPAENVYILSTSSLPQSEYGWEVYMEVPLKSSMMIQPRTRMPDATRSRGGAFVLYRKTATGAVPTPR